MMHVLNKDWDLRNEGKKATMNGLGKTNNL